MLCYKFPMNVYPPRSLLLCGNFTFWVVVFLPCRLKKTCWNRSVFRSFFGFCDIFPSEPVLKWSKKGEKRRKNVIKLHKSEYFLLCKTLAISQNKNNSKKVKKSLKKSWRERKKSYLCTRKTTGTRGWEKREVVERSSLKEWSKQSLKGKCRKNLINSEDRSESRQKTRKKRYKSTKKSLILAQDER